MDTKISLPVKVLYYTDVQYTQWKDGDRDGCPDPYCRKLPGTYGFGENLVGHHFHTLGYNWIHHDYNVFGGNKTGKYPKGEDVLIKCWGEEKVNAVRSLYSAFGNIEEPDLLIYRPDYSEIRFAEAKRIDTKDKLRDQQVRGLALLSLLFGCRVDIFEVTPIGVENQERQIVWSL